MFRLLRGHSARRTEPWPATLTTLACLAAALPASARTPDQYTAQKGLRLGAHAFYRSSNWNGRMSLVPAVMPVSTLLLPAAGLSFNFAYVPRVAAYNKSMPEVLHLQLGFRLP